MNEKHSFTGLENNFHKEMRVKINNCEDRIDLENHFSFVSANLLRRAFQNKNLSIGYDDVIFDYGANTHFAISKKLKSSPVFREIWLNSDLPDIIGRFAGSTYHKFLHIGKHPAKSEQKLRN